MDRQQEFVLRTLEERQIRFVRLWFTDVLGLPEVGGGRARPSSTARSPRASASTARRSRASPGPARATCSPGPTRPPSRSCPAADGRPSDTARMFCDITMPDGSPSWADPRYVLRRTLSKAADTGFTFYTHPEIEFFLLKDRPDATAPSRRRSTTAATST